MARMGGLFLFFVFVLLPRARDVSRAFGFFLFLFFFSFHCPGPETCLRSFFIFLSFLFCFILFYFTGPERCSPSPFHHFYFLFFTSQGLRCVLGPFFIIFYYSFQLLDPALLGCS